MDTLTKDPWSGLARRYLVGLDLGQGQESSALAVVDRPDIPPTSPVTLRRPPYRLRHLERFPGGTPYKEVLYRLRDLLGNTLLQGASVLLDVTAVGSSITRLLAENLENRVTCHFYPVFVSEGIYPAYVDAQGVLVTRLELIGTMQLVLQSQRLRIPQSLGEVPLLIKELCNFKLKASSGPADPLQGWRDGEQEDLVVAVGLAIWWGEKGLPPLVQTARERAPDKIGH